MTPIISGIFLAAVLVTSSRSALAQGEGPPPSHEGGPDRPDGRMRGREGGDPALLRERIARRLEESREEVARLETVLRRIDAGGRPEGDADRPRNPRERGQPEPGPVGGPLRQAVREHVLAFLREHNPEFARHLDELREQRPDLADRALSEFAGHLRELGELRDKDPELFAIRLESHKVDWHMRRAVFEAVRAARAEGPEKGVDMEQLRARLGPLVEQRFRLSLRERAHSVGQLERRIGELREETARDEAEAPRIVGERLDRLMEHVARMASERPPFERGEPRHERPGRPGRGGAGGPLDGEGARSAPEAPSPARGPEHP